MIWFALYWLPDRYGLIYRHGGKSMDARGISTDVSDIVIVEDLINISKQEDEIIPTMSLRNSDFEIKYC